MAATILLAAALLAAVDGTIVVPPIYSPARVRDIAAAIVAREGPRIEALRRWRPEGNDTIVDGADGGARFLVYFVTNNHREYLRMLTLALLSAHPALVALRGLVDVAVVLPRAILPWVWSTSLAPSLLPTLLDGGYADRPRPRPGPDGRRPRPPFRLLLVPHDEGTGGRVAARSKLLPVLFDARAMRRYTGGVLYLDTDVLVVNPARLVSLLLDGPDPDTLHAYAERAWPLDSVFHSVRGAGAFSAPEDRAAAAAGLSPFNSGIMLWAHDAAAAAAAGSGSCGGAGCADVPPGRVSVAMSRALAAMRADPRSAPPFEQPWINHFARLGAASDTDRLEAFVTFDELEEWRGGRFAHAALVHMVKGERSAGMGQMKLSRMLTVAARLRLGGGGAGGGGPRGHQEGLLDDECACHLLRGPQYDSAEARGAPRLHGGRWFSFSHLCEEFSVQALDCRIASRRRGGARAGELAAPPGGGAGGGVSTGAVAGAEEPRSVAQRALWAAEDDWDARTRAHGGAFATGNSCGRRGKPEVRWRVGSAVWATSPAHAWPLVWDALAGGAQPADMD